MLNGRNEYQVFNETEELEVAVIANLGDRDEQQDCSGYELEDDYSLVVVCDGMGGMEGGRHASHLAVGEMLTRFRMEEKEDISALFRTILQGIDSKVAALHRTDGTLMNAGTTMVAAAVYRKGLYWVSVGDSRIYIKRGRELIQVTKDHNYEAMLQQSLSTGAITPAIYEERKARGAALTSYLGMNGVQLMDINSMPMQVIGGDRILLTSDGLYKLLSLDEISNILDSFPNIQDALRALENNAHRNAKIRGVRRDNLTVALIRIK